ncbi:CxC ATPase DNA modification system associated small protein [Plesiomonas shigelloides]|uniref:CxC ATPase DNA modification system associated small protein n=1 Tax=Plesiomonas shigelloides TaxID=703 RepID=UPI001261B612|nr:CxC ATPase DNA modification system associated small protein [Plesiomonas shigelloides]KAB7653190.1 hypothetical protein GBN14_15260 [Plesiomonas shigelloides]
MDINAFKALLEEAAREAEMTHKSYENQSASHKAALQIMNFEKELHYGDLVRAHHIQNIKNIIEMHAEDIANETNKA